MERTENDRTVFRPSHKTLKIDETDFHIPTATTTTEQSFHSKPEKPVQTNGAAAVCSNSLFILRNRSKAEDTFSYSYRYHRQANRSFIPLAVQIFRLKPNG
jgi:hypothetical protein